MKNQAKKPYSSTIKGIKLSHKGEKNLKATLKELEKGKIKAFDNMEDLIKNLHKYENKLSFLIRSVQHQVWRWTFGQE